MIKNKFIKKRKNLFFIFSFILFNILFVLLVSIFQIYQRYIDLNASILNGVSLAIKNGILISDLRGSVKDIADSYIESGVMSSSYLFSNEDRVSLSNRYIENCDFDKYLFTKSLNEGLFISLSKGNKNHFYFCFNNKFHSNSSLGRKHIATWITGFPIKLSSISSYLSHIIVLSGVILIASIIILYRMLLKQEELRKKELTFDIASRIKHEIVRPVAKIQSVSEILYSNINKISTKEIKEKIYQINLLTKTHKLFVWSIFSYVLHKDNKKIALDNDEIDINQIFDKCLNISIQDKVKNYSVNKNISKFLEENYIIIDESYFAISILNILTNAYEAVQRNHKCIHLKFEMSAHYEEKNNELIISIKNYGSYIEKSNYKSIFNSGITNNAQTNSGYGLSILKDIVDFYDGSIQVESELNRLYPEKSWVKFKIIFKKIKYSKKINNSIANISKYEYSIFKNEIKILIADDEVFFIDYFKIIFNDYPDCFKVYYTYTVNDAIEVINNNLIDIAILDLKFGTDENGGFKIIEKLNVLYTYILVHSSSFFKDHNSISSLISEFVQKTLTKDKLFDTISDIYQKKYLTNEHYIKSIETINVIIVDDESYLYDDWQKINPNIHFRYFNYFDELLDSLDSNYIDLDNIDVILTDYYFDKIRLGLTLLTTDYLSNLKNIYGYKGFIVLASNISLAKNYENIDAVIDKRPRKIDLLIKELKNISFTP